jgi:hypothetical protein
VTRWARTPTLRTAKRLQKSTPMLRAAKPLQKSGYRKVRRWETPNSECFREQEPSRASPLPFCICLHLMAVPVTLAHFNYSKQAVFFIGDAGREKQMFIDEMKPPQTIELERRSVRFR